MDVHEGAITFIANPKSGATSRKRLSQEFYRYLLEHGHEVHFVPTTSLGHACDLARTARANKNCSLVVAAGGDGTIREVAHGLQGSTTPLLIIPTGTENLLASELGFDERLSTVIKTFKEQTIRPFDMGLLNGKSFICVVGVGFDGEVVERVNRFRQGHIDYFDYIDPIWQTFWSHVFPTIQVTVDQEEVYEGPGMAFVGNISRYATGLKILHRADYGDGLLDICIYKCGHRPHLAKHALFTMVKKHTVWRDVIYTQGENITIRSQRTDTRSEIDGDPGPSLPLDIRVIPQALRVLTQKNAKPAGLRTRILRAIG